MAKGNLFLGQAKGKLGSLVFARAFGQQITRTKPTSVKNPKTIGQNNQRAVLATIAKSAALLTPIVDHSFANIAYGAGSVRHFRKINMGILRNMLLSSVGTNYNLSAKGAGAVPNALKVSEGSLPAFKSAYQDEQVGFYMGKALASISNCTVLDFKQSYPYIQGGDQLTLVKIVKTSGTLVDGDAIFALKVDRIVFSPTAFDDPNAFVILDDGTINTSLLDLTKTTNTECLQGVDAGGGKGIGCTTDNDNTYAAALILSRKVNNVWQRSTQYLELSEFKDFTDNTAAIESYGASSSLDDSTEYLNQAEEGSSSEGVRGSYMTVAYVNDGEAVDPTYVNAGSEGQDSLSVANGKEFEIIVNGYAESGVRIITAEIDGIDGNALVHGAKSCSTKIIASAETVGNYNIAVVYNDGSRALLKLAVKLKS